MTAVGVQAKEARSAIMESILYLVLYVCATKQPKTQKQKRKVGGCVFFLSFFRFYFESIFALPAARYDFKNIFFRNKR